MTSGDSGRGRGGEGTSGPRRITDSEVAAVTAALVSAIGDYVSCDTALVSPQALVEMYRAQHHAAAVLAGRAPALLAQILSTGGLDGLGRNPKSALVELLNVSEGDARRHVLLAEKLGPRSELGQQLPPEWEYVAAAVREGVITDGHLSVIIDFHKKFPATADEGLRSECERALADTARTVTPRGLAAVAARLLMWIDEDGDTPADGPDPARERFLRMGAQDAHGYTRGSFYIDAECRLLLETIFAKWARRGVNNPGMNNPDENDPDQAAPGGGTPEPADLTSDSSLADLFGDLPPGNAALLVDAFGPNLLDTDPLDTDPLDIDPLDTDNSASAANPPDGPPLDGPPLDGPPLDDPPLDDPPPEPPAPETEPPGTAADVRTKDQRQHDALAAVLRAVLASGISGQHRGSPVTAVITVRLRDLEERAGLALSNTGTVLTARDAIRLASHTSPYLLLLGEHERPLYLGRSHRLATHHQRLALTALDRGCSFPGCTRPATHCQTHHTTDWAQGGRTDIDQLTFACEEHHGLVGNGPAQWATTIAPAGHQYAGRTLWHPPSIVDPDRIGRVNLYHHPEDLLCHAG